MQVLCKQGKFGNYHKKSVRDSFVIKNEHKVGDILHWISRTSLFLRVGDYPAPELIATVSIDRP